MTDKLKKLIELLANVAIVAICALIGFTLITHKTLNLGAVVGEAPRTQKVEMPLGSDWYALGRTDAPVTIVEFMDLECPFCRQFEVTTLGTLRKNYIDTGKLRFFTMDLPLPMHQYAVGAAEAARCAGEHGEFWQFRNSVLGESAPPEPLVLLKVAGQLNLNLEEFQACVRSNKYNTTVQSHHATAAAVGIDGTPGFVIGRLNDGVVQGISVIGAQPYSFFEREIEMVLKESPPASAKPVLPQKGVGSL